jgi:nicotinate-nucleotide adenylyltransferase
MKVGLFFGSFNPIHIGHLIIADTMLSYGKMDQIWFVVSPQNPLKKKATLAHAFDRLTMVRQAIADNPAFNASDIEFSMPIPSYTIDTLTYLSEKYPQHQFHLIIGQDNLASFHKWKNYQLLLQNYLLLVYPRPQSPPSEFDKHPSIQFVPAPLIEISSTYIRQALQAEKSVRYLLHPDVAAFIRLKKLYIK